MPQKQPQRERILELMGGFRPACILGAAAELDLWGRMGRRKATARQWAELLGGNLRALTMLLDALVALELLEKEGEEYAVPAPLHRWLDQDGEETLLPMLQHSANILRGWSELAWVVKAGIPAPRPSSIRGPAADRASFIAAMHSISAICADDLVGQLGEPAFKHLLDVGGASGTWTFAFLRAAPHAVATIFDLPDAIAQARQRISGTEFAGRITLVGGDFYADDLPGNADFAWVSAICHQHSRVHNRELFSKVFRALEPGGRIAVRDIVMDSCRTRPVEGALFAINMLVNTESGGVFTFGEFAEDLQAAGFENPQWKVRHPAMNSVIVAVKR